MGWCFTSQLQPNCTACHLFPQLNSLSHPLQSKISTFLPLFSSKPPLLPACLAHFHFLSASITPCSGFQQRLCSSRLQLRIALSSCIHCISAAKIGSSIYITSFNMSRNRGSSLFGCRKEKHSRISALNSGGDKESMPFSTADGGGSQREGHNNPLSSVNPYKKILTLPTILTLGRVAAVPALFFGFYTSERWAATLVACIFVSAAITDWLDGFLARKMNTHSEFGAFLDPVADKLMVATILVLLSTERLQVSWAAACPWLIPLPATSIIGREITMSAVREWAASQGGDLQAAVAVNRLGKWKTAFQMVALTALLVTRGCSQNSVTSLLLAIGVGSLYISAGLALWSLAVYMKGIWGAMIK